MTNKILDAISQALNTEFGDSYELYSENIILLNKIFLEIDITGSIYLIFSIFLKIRKAQTQNYMKCKKDFLIVWNI